VGTKGMPGLIAVLKNDRSDADIIKATLDTLTTLCTSDKNNKDVNKIAIHFKLLSLSDSYFSLSI